MIKPTIGRRVWFWPCEADCDPAHADQIRQHDKTQPLDAGIAYVWGDRMINITVADQNGRMHSRCSVVLRQEGDIPTAAGQAYAEWMPYQAAQAKAA